ncbi:DNA-directed DNA polymerase eta rad30, partial [Nowakowskiella sp. JEL0078]
MANIMACKQRVIIHIDLDCFYAQVEHVRLGIPFYTPLAVRQWDALIAVKHTTAKEAKVLCPDCKSHYYKFYLKDIILQHVATYKSGDSFPTYHDSPNQQSHKVSLDIYRMASRNIFTVMKSVIDRYCLDSNPSKVGSYKLEKASIDEAFFDVTNLISWWGPEDGEIESVRVDQDGFLIDWTGLGFLIGDVETVLRGGIDDVRLYLGAKIGAELRKTVFEQLGYTCSTGVAQNKTLAKLCSPLNKPNNQ